MYKKSLMIILLTARCIYADQANQSAQMTPYDIASFVKTHADDPTFCKKVTWRIEVKVSPDVDLELWRSIIHPFVDVTIYGERAQENDYAWLNTLGYFIGDSIALSGDKTGIHGNVTGNFTPNSILLSGEEERNAEVDEQAWKQIVLIWADFIEWMAHASETRDYESSKGVGDLLKTIFQACGQEGLHVMIAVQWENEQGEPIHAQFATK